MTGALTETTLDSAAMISLALSQMTLTSASGSNSHLESLTMYSSKFPISEWASLDILNYNLIRWFYYMQWIPLQLDMLPTISIETSKVIELYRVTTGEVQNGNGHLAPKLKELKAVMANRVQQLDRFYRKYHYDQRVHLFHRLKLQLKKVLSKHVQEIDNSYLQAQSLDVSKVREELAMIESSLEKEYDNIPEYSQPVVTLNQNQIGRQSLIGKKKQSSVKPSKTTKKVSKLNLDKIRPNQPNNLVIQSRPIVPSQTQSKRQLGSNRTPRVQPSPKHLQHPLQTQPKQKLQQIVFTIKMTKQEYLQFLQAKKLT